MSRFPIVVSGVLLLMVLTLNSVSFGSQVAWPQFRGPGGLGIALDDKSYPAQLDPEQNLLWKTEIPRGHSSPCIWGDDIFLTACSGKRLETICLDRGSGKIKWRRSIEVENLEQVNGSNSHATPTVACDGEGVYVYFGSFGLLAYDVDGTERWRRPLPDPRIFHGTGSSPILANNMVILCRDPGRGASIMAMNPQTGETIWEHKCQRRQPGWTTPMLWKHGDQEELIVHRTGSVASYDLEDGHKRWWFDCSPSYMYHSALTPVYAGNTLFVGVAIPSSGDPINPIELPDFKELLDMYDADENGRLVKDEIPDDLAYSYRTGSAGGAGVKSRFSRLDTDEDGAISEMEWSKIVTDIVMTPPKAMDALYAIRAGGKDEISPALVKWKAHEGIGQIPSPFHYQGRVYLIKHGGTITCYDAETGKKLYSGRVGPRTYYFASPIGADGKIYFCSMNGAIIVLKASDQFEVLAQNKISARIYATPALVDGNVYLRTRKSMYAFKRLEDGAESAKPVIVVKPKADQGKTLYEAAADGDIARVKSLLAGDAEVNTANDWGWTPLYVAVATDKSEVVEMLLANGADPNTGGNQGQTALQLALGNDQKDIVRSLIAHGADVHTPGKNGITPLHTAAGQGDLALVELLLEKGADVNVKAKSWVGTPLNMAAFKGHADVAEFLLNKGANINSRNDANGTPLHGATLGEHKHVVTLLIEHGADVNAENDGAMTPLGFADRGEYTEIAELLRQHGATMGTQPLIQAITVEKIDRVKSLLAEGADVNVKLKDGGTPLLTACGKGNKEIVELLLAEGADVNVKLKNGGTP
ncbi:ankyrin repeat domain-containing protein, partial [Planctomycetota bacterium]